MAQLEVLQAQSALSEAIRHLKEKNLFSDENAAAILAPGAELMLANAKSAFLQSGHNNTKPRRTGDTFKAFYRAQKVFKDKNGAPYMFVSLEGKDRRGQRYGAKAFILNYGRRTGGKIPADYYLSNAVKATRPQANRLMVQKIEEILKK